MCNVLFMRLLVEGHSELWLILHWLIYYISQTRSMLWNSVITLALKVDMNKNGIKSELCRIVNHSISSSLFIFFLTHAWLIDQLMITLDMYFIVAIFYYTLWCHKPYSERLMWWLILHCSILFLFHRKILCTILFLGLKWWWVPHAQ